MYTNIRAGIISTKIRRLKTFDFDPAEIERTKAELAKLDDLPAIQPVEDEDEEPEKAPEEEEEEEPEKPDEDEAPVEEDELADPDHCTVTSGDFSNTRAGEV